MSLLNPLERCQALTALDGLGLRAEGAGYSDQELHLALILLSAWGVERISHINDQPTVEWGVLLDTTRRPDSSTVDQYLGQLLAEDERDSPTTAGERLGQIRPGGLIDQAQRESLRCWAEAGLLAGEVWYFDGHVIEYTGAAAIGKTKHGTKQTSVKAIQRFTLANGLCSLTEYFHVSVPYAQALLILLEKAQASLPPDLQIGKLCFDREGWDAELLVELEKQYQLVPITWVKQFANNRCLLANVPAAEFVQVNDMPIGKEDSQEVVALADTTCTFAQLGEKRVVVLETNQEQRLGIYTTARHPSQTGLDDPHTMTTLALVDALRLKQRIENQFKVDKHEMGSDCLPGQHTYPAHLALPYDLDTADQTLSRAQKRLDKYQEQMNQEQALYEEQQLDKHQLNHLAKRTHRLQLKAQQEIDTLQQELQMVQTDEKGQTFLPTQVTCLDVRKLTLLNLFKQHAFVALKLLAIQLGLAEANPQRLRRSFLAFGSHIHFDHKQRIATVYAQPFPRKSVQLAYEQYCGAMSDIPISLSRNGITYRVRFSC